MNVLRRLSVTFNRICRNILLCKQRDVPVVQLYSRLAWLDIYQQIKYELAIMAYKVLHNLDSYNIIYPPFTYEITNYPLRDVNNFRLPPNNNPFVRRTISYRSSTIWNELPAAVRNQASLFLFKKHLKIYLLNNSLS